MARESLKEIMSGVEFTGKPKLLARSTVQYTRPDGAIAVRFHHTDVVVTKGNIVTLDTGGWNTVTTRERMNSFSPIRVYTKAGALFANGFPMAQTITFKKDIAGTFTPVGIKKLEMEAVRQEKTREQIKKFCSRVTKEATIPMPSNGDCWGCLMVEKETGKHMSYDCLMGHVKENYLHGSLLVRAMREAGFQGVGIVMYLDNGTPAKWGRQVIKRSLQKLLYRAAGV